MATELKPCPFCGGKARMKHGFPARQCKGQRQAVVQCEVCGCRTVTYKQLAYQAWSDVDRLAEEAWNRRAAKTPCDLCKFNPPTSMDGKPCTMCVADGRAEDGK